MLNKKTNTKNRSNAGFTLVELLVAMGIMVMIAMSSAWFVIHGFRYNRIIWDQLETQNDGRRVLQDVVNTVRKAEESSLGGYPLVVASDYELTFYANIDDDSLRERVHFWLDDTTIKKGTIKPSGNPLSFSGTEDVVEIAHHVVNIAEGNPLFLYYDENYSGTEAALVQPVEIVDVRTLRVQLELEENPDETPVPLHVESLVQIRNLKEN